MSGLIWLQDGALGVWVAESIRGYPIVLACHAVGMAAVVGAVVMICLRSLGFANAVPVAFFVRLSAVIWLGLALNVLTGCALFSGDPVKFFYHPVFWLKLSLVSLGVASIWLLLRSLREADRSPIRAPRNRIRLLAGLSLTFWIGALGAGRLIAYIEFGGG